MKTPDDIRSIYLSPHYDDIAFSLGAWVAANPSGTLVNIFTRSAYVAGGGRRGVPTSEEIERISALRRAEESGFAERYNLDRIELGAEEPSLRGREPWDHSGLKDDCDSIGEPLAAALAALTAQRSPTRIFCPAGIGGHVNHLATRAVLLNLIASLPQTQLCFYEDLPYAARGSVRRRGLADLRKATNGDRLRRRWWKAETSKLGDINRYASQHRDPVTDLHRFSPAALWPPYPHEAVWDLEPST